MPLPSSELFPGGDRYPGADIATAITIDPTEVATARSELLLNDGAIRVAPPGPDWGESSITAYMADQMYGSSAVDYRIPNRQVRIPLLLGADGPANFDTARRALTAKVALLQREGGWLGRGSGLYADVVNATLGMPDEYGHLGVQADVVLTLECLPDFYGDEETLTVHSSATGELVFTEAAIDGDHPARCRLVVSEGAGADQLGLIWGIRSRHYDDAATAALVYEAEALTPLDAAAVVTLSGASGGASNNAVRHNSLAAAWTPVLSTDLLAGDALTHTGSYRLWARVYSTSPSSSVAVNLRFLWDVGDFTAASDNAVYAIPGASNFYIADLGEIRIDRLPAGTHRWKGVMQAKGTAGGENVYVDKLWLQPLDEGAGRVVYVPDAGVGLAGFSAHDEFGQTAGSLTAKTLPVGGTWSGGGDADDYTVDATNHYAQRTATADVDQYTGRYATASTPSPASAVVTVDTSLSINSNPSGVVAQGVIARFVDTSNNLTFTVAQSLGGLSAVSVTKRVGGTPTVLYQTPSLAALLPVRAVSAFYTLTLIVDAAGRWSAYYGPQGAATLVASGQDSALATGGTLASGKVGIYDVNTSATACTRQYDNFAAWAPTSDAALFAGRSAELRHDAILREISGGGSYGPASSVIGDLPRIPPSGDEARPAQLLVKTTRGDLDQLPDTAADALSAQLKIRPCWLFRP